MRVFSDAYSLLFTFIVGSNLVKGESLVTYPSEKIGAGGRRRERERERERGNVRGGEKNTNSGTGEKKICRTFDPPVLEHHLLGAYFHTGGKVLHHTLLLCLFNDSQQEVLDVAVGDDRLLHRPIVTPQLGAFREDACPLEERIDHIHRKGPQNFIPVPLWLLVKENKVTVQRTKMLFGVSNNLSETRHLNTTECQEEDKR